MGQGEAILRRFVLDICKCRADWIMGDHVGEAVERIRADVGTEEVILGLSGGVDSSVAAALIYRAIGAQLTCVFVDTGLLRLNEGQQVIDTFQKHMGMKLIAIDATARFMDALQGVADPEDKRRIIGREFVHVFQEEAAKQPNAKWLAQGTIYPDVIESAGAKSKKATTIKSHHNVGGLPETLHLKLLYQNPAYDKLFEKLRTLDDGPEKQAGIDEMVEIAQRDAPWSFGFYPWASTAVHRWVKNSKPAILIRDHGRYLRLDTQERVASIAAWNKPLWWPLAVLLALLVGALLFARRSLRKRERMNARGEIIAA